MTKKFAATAIAVVVSMPLIPLLVTTIEHLTRTDVAMVFPTEAWRLQHQTSLAEARLKERTAANRNRFYIYLDQDSGFKHGLPTGFFANSGSFAAHSAYSDNFEASPLNAFWTVSQQYGNVSLSTDVNHTQGGRQSLKFTSSSGGQRNIGVSHQFASPQQGVFSVWFYDLAPDSETQYEQIELYNSATTDLATIGTQHFDPYCYRARLCNYNMRLHNAYESGDIALPNGQNGIAWEFTGQVADRSGNGYEGYYEGYRHQGTAPPNPPNQRRSAESSVVDRGTRGTESANKKGVAWSPTAHTETSVEPGWYLLDVPSKDFTVHGQIELEFVSDDGVRRRVTLERIRHVGESTRRLDSFQSTRFIDG